MNLLKFEYVFAFAVLSVLSLALFVFRADSEVVKMILVAIVGALSAITAFFFTKTNPKE